MKIMERGGKGHWTSEKMLLSEVELLQFLAPHPSIIEFHGLYEDGQYLYAVLEKCSGGEVFEAILSKRRFSENRTSFLVYQMLVAVKYVHSRNIVHRDIKAENFLFVNGNPDSPVKLIDFGMSVRLTQKESDKRKTLSDICGSPHYLSPELIKRNYDFKADIWALGVLTFLMLFGVYPFDGSNTAEIVKKVLNCQIAAVYIPERQVYRCGDTTLSAVATDFVRLLMRRNPAHRPTAQQAIMHPWLQNARQFYQHRSMTLSSLPSSHTSSLSCVSTIADEEDASQHASLYLKAPQSRDCLVTEKKMPNLRAP